MLLKVDWRDCYFSRLYSLFLCMLIAFWYSNKIFLLIIVGDCAIVQPYDQVAVVEITLMNTGHVGFEFVGIDVDPCLETSPKPGLAFIMPHRVCSMQSCW